MGHDMELHFLSLHQKHGASEMQDDERSTVLMLGFCASCCHPVTESNVMRKDIDGEHLLLCSESCEAKILDGAATVTQMYSYHW